MSVSLYWEPVIRRARVLPDKLRYAICPKIFDHDGTLASKPITLTHDDIPYLEGLRDGGVKAAQALIEAIERYSAVSLWTEG